MLINLILTKSWPAVAGINNLDTVISGPYITLRPDSGSPVSEIAALTKPPVLESVATGLNIILHDEAQKAWLEWQPAITLD